MGKANVTTNEGAREIACAFWFRADAHQADGDDVERDKGGRLGSYNMAGNAYRQAHDWFCAARGMTIGHNKSARYEAQADDMRKKCLKAYDCARTLNES